MTGKIQLENVSYIYGSGTPYEVKALDGINLAIRGNTVTGLIGHTGSGKSTLVQLLNGLHKPQEGRVLLDGEDIWEKPKEIRKIRFRVGLVMQYPEYQLFEETVRADIAYGPRNMGLSEEEITRRVEEAAELTGLSPLLLEHSPFELSGGQKRRVAIAGVIAMQPEVLVLDEPAAGLDPRGRDSILQEICQYQKKTKATVLIVSHSMEDMARYCEDMIVMSGAHVIMQGRGSEIFSRTEELEAVGLDVPEISRVCRSLRAKGIPLDDGIFTVEAACENLARLFREKKEKATVFF